MTQLAQRADGQTSDQQLPRPRRIVTGHDESGRSIIVSDGPAPNVVASGAAVQQGQRDVGG